MKKIIPAAALVAVIAIMTPGPPASAGEVTRHTVSEGETLWDLSEKYMTDPEFWDEIWQLNPDLLNPNWIYPGQEILIPVRPKREDIPEATPRLIPEDEAPPLRGSGRELPLEVTRPESPEITPEDEPEEEEEKPWAALAEKVAHYHDRGIGMVTWDIPDDGRVLNSVGGWHHSAAQETVLIKAPGARPGDRLGVYRDLGKVDSPKFMGKSPGNLLADIGIIEVIDSEDGRQRGRVIRSFTELKHGDTLGPVPEPPEVTAAALDEEAARIPARVVAVQHDRLVASSGDIVYLDRGGDQGLAPGQRLFVGSPDDDDTSGRRAELMVLRVTPERAAALVTSGSKNHVRPGDRVGLDH